MEEKKKAAPEKAKDIFTIAGVDYKMVGVNADGSPVLKSLAQLKEEKEVEDLKKQLSDLIKKLEDKGVNMRISFSGTSQAGIEIFDEVAKRFLQRYF